MKRVHILVEGQTEETFAKEILGPHLLAAGIALNVIVVATKYVKAGSKFRGGITSFDQVKRDLTRLLSDTDALAITTMFDFYALPEDFPGMAGRTRGLPGVTALERAMGKVFNDHRLIPYLALHEFEALLLADPGEIEAAVRKPGLHAKLASVVEAAGGPEDVNDGELTHPAARIVALANDYRKTFHGIVVAKRIGLQPIRAACPHFNGWVSRLESLSVQ